MRKWQHKTEINKVGHIDYSSAAFTFDVKLSIAIMKDRNSASSGNIESILAINMTLSNLTQPKSRKFHLHKDRLRDDKMRSTLFPSDHLIYRI